MILVIAGIALYRDRQNRDAVAAAQISRLAEQMASRIDRFFNPVGEDLLLVRQWSLNGTLTLSEPDLLAAKFSPLLRNHPQIFGFFLWEQGRLSFVLVRDGEGLLMGHTRSESSKDGWVWGGRDADGKMTDQWSEALRDPAGLSDDWRRAPDLKGQGSIVWSPARSFPPAGMSGLSAATAWQKEHIGHVAAAGVLNTQIAQLLNDIRAGSSYRFFLFSRSGVFIDFQNPSAPVSPDSGAGEPGSAPQDPILAAAGQAWRQGGEIDVPFGFDVAGEPQYGLIHGLQGSRQQAGVGVIASRTDLLRHLPLNRFFFVPAGLGLLWCLLLAAALRMGRPERPGRGKKPLQAMTAAELIALIEQGETDTLEFKSTLRWNLRSGKAGKEIELACLKTVAAFMNTDGGTLLVGVADNGTIHGIAADNFPNDDKYLRHFSAIFEQHIGLNFTEFIEFALLPAAGVSVFAVRCRRSPRPVFITNKKDEMFFIRSGPSSRQLTTSQTLAYLEERGQREKG